MGSAQSFIANHACADVDVLQPAYRACPDQAIQRRHLSARARRWPHRIHRREHAVDRVLLPVRRLLGSGVPGLPAGLSIPRRRIAAHGAGRPRAGRGTTGPCPKRFSFDPLRRHYLIASYTKPKINDDWTIGATLIAGLADLSGTVFPIGVPGAPRSGFSCPCTASFPFAASPSARSTVNDINYSEYSLVADRLPRALRGPRLSTEEPTTDDHSACHCQGQGRRLASLSSLHNIIKEYHLGKTLVPALCGVDFELRAASLPSSWARRVGQVDAAQHHRLPRPADQRDLSVRRPTRSATSDFDKLAGLRNERSASSSSPST